MDGATCSETEPTGSFARYAAFAALLLLGLPRPVLAGGWIRSMVQHTRWGESSEALLDRFGKRATRLPWPLDFGDSYTDVVLRSERLDGYRVLVYFQMGKRSRGLKRIQIERPRHGVNPPAYRALLAAVSAAYGPPDATCTARPSRANGYQAGWERTWFRKDDAIRLIYRDTTIEALEGCLGEAAAPCGLTGQILLRIAPTEADVRRCSLAGAG